MDARFSHALEQMPPAVADYLRPLLQSEQFDGTLSAQQFSELKDLSCLSDKELRVRLLPLAAAYSYTPISHFNVGAICRGVSGRLYFGGNIEFSTVQLGQTVHAEQCAISHAWMKGEHGVKDITVNYSPCGHCRQFMNELSTAEALRIQLPERQEQSLQYYLPESFGPKDLDIDARLMKPSSLHYQAPDKSDVLRKAVEAMNKSHAPYTHNHSGVALLLNDGSIYNGAYAENAAFNPSLPPLQVALIQVLMASKHFTQIVQAGLAETETGIISHYSATRTTLDSINSDILLEYLML
ncbi:cytidine deaminase [Vibrio albus]|uniref:Cytidine deaminase n=1 Tax=Vibrio albus TaxID=2200953 RepID=A0A2U3BDS5_9VIBR|nr:cytidine deaminase [Vibrio albus]PWI34884.1 cytidine deaminase [Vibrio albus]